jgi:hypothetical protein
MDILMKQLLKNLFNNMNDDKLNELGDGSQGKNE